MHYKNEAVFFVCVASTKVIPAKRQEVRHLYLWASLTVLKHTANCFREESGRNVEFMDLLLPPSENSQEVPELAPTVQILIIPFLDR